MKFKKVLNESEKNSNRWGEKSQIAMQILNSYIDDIIEQSVNSSCEFAEYEGFIDKKFIEEIIKGTDAFEELMKELGDRGITFQFVEEKIINRIYRDVVSNLEDEGINISD